VTAELNIQSEDLCDVCCVHGRAAIAKPLIVEVMLRCVNDIITTVQPGHQKTGNESFSFIVVLTLG
jgi:hypothetical protein